jgi:hypothetical protein
LSEEIKAFGEERRDGTSLGQRSSPAGRKFEIIRLGLGKQD